MISSKEQDTCDVCDPHRSVMQGLPVGNLRGILPPRTCPCGGEGRAHQALVSEFLFIHITMHMGPGGSRAAGCSTGVCSPAILLCAVKRSDSPSLSLNTSSQSVTVAPPPAAMAALCCNFECFQIFRIERLVSPEQFLSNIRMFYQ